jgi:hypothetical protein
MIKRILYGLAQMLLVIAFAMLIPAGAVLALKLSGAQEPEMVGWVGVLLLVLIYSPMSAAVSALILGTVAMLIPARTAGQIIMAIMSGILHGAVFLLVVASPPVMIAASIASSLLVLVMTTIHVARREQNSLLENIGTSAPNSQQ